METIFAKIINKEIPADIVYEDESVLAFLDIRPVQPGHTLVVPKVWSVNGLSIEPALLGHLMIIAQKIAQAQMEVLKADGVNFIMNNGEAAGQDVFHTHLHVIPRYLNDGARAPFTHSTYEPGEKEAVAAALAARVVELS